MKLQSLCHARIFVLGNPVPRQPVARDGEVVKLNTVIREREHDLSRRVEVVAERDVPAPVQVLVVLPDSFVDGVDAAVRHRDHARPNVEDAVERTHLGITGPDR